MARILINAAALLFLCGQIALYGQVRLDPEAAERLLLERPVPVFSPIAQAALVQDTVQLQITVSEAGSVIDVKINSGHPLVNDTAIYSVSQSKYKPYLLEGKTVPFVTVVDIPFLPGISQKDYDRDRKLAVQYYEAEDNCRGLLNDSQWQQAEATCIANLAMADKLGKWRVRTKVRAYQMAGSSMLGQNKFKESLKYLDRSLNIGKTILLKDDADLGDLNVMIGLTHSKMGNQDKAMNYYVKGEEVFQLGYNRSRFDPSLRSVYLPRLRKALEYHISAAETAGAANEAETLKKRLADLPK